MMRTQNLFKYYRTIEMDRASIYRGNLVLVNKENPLRIETETEDLRFYEESQYGIYVNNRTAIMLTHLMSAIGGSGHIVPVSGYRSRSQQVHIYEDSMKENGPDFTAQFVALPGCSEHQTGLAVDLGENREEIDFLRPHFPNDGVCQKFREKAEKFGFIERYKAHKENITGIGDEPWHFRYVGYPHSEIMERFNLALEEYTEFLKQYPEDGKHYFFKVPGREVEIFYREVRDDETPLLKLPEQVPYMISGNNVDGLVVTIWR